MTELLENYLLLDESRRHKSSGIKGPGCVELTVGEVMELLNSASRAEFDGEAAERESERMQEKIEDLKDELAEAKEEANNADKSKAEARRVLETALGSLA